MSRADKFLVTSILAVFGGVLVIRQLGITEPEITLLGSIIVALIGLYGTIRKNTSPAAPPPAYPLLSQSESQGWFGRLATTFLNIMLGIALVIVLGAIGVLMFGFRNPDLARGILAEIFQTCSSLSL